MTLVDILWYVILPVIAIDYVMTQATVTEGLRRRAGSGPLGYLLHCSICMAPWIGFFVIGSCIMAADIFLTHAPWPAARTVFRYAQTAVLCGTAAIATMYVIEIFKKGDEDDGGEEEDGGGEGSGWNEENEK